MCIARRVSQSQFWRAMLGRTLGLFVVFPTLVGGHHWSLGTTFLGSWGDWLWGLVSPRINASQPAFWFVLPTSWESDWVYHKLGNAPVLRSGTGSWVLSGQSGDSHPLSPVIRLGLRNPRKKERKTLQGTRGVATQLARQLQQEHTQMWSNREARKRPPQRHSRNGPWDY